MTDFAAIDFETANQHRSSVCSVGLVVVRNGQITDKIYSLIRPVPNFYAWFCTDVHGLTYVDTMYAGDFPKIWEKIVPRIAGLPLAAHNSPFDESCLRTVHTAYGLEYPDYRYFCTCQASRRIFGKILPNHQLQTVAAQCGYNLTHHHNALADAEACAEIAIQLGVSV
jgi:DNA polymerase-3 subunit epsilon